VIHDEDTNKMIDIITKFHYKHHFGVNKTREYLNNIYHKIKREYIRQIISVCLTCSQSQSLKIKQSFIHIKAKHQRERLQIDCVDLSAWAEFNDGNKYILNIIDVFSKFCMVCFIKDKSAETIKKYWIPYSTLMDSKNNTM
ncbi:hypothetical protein DMUE_6024, partial [Dictyocoela muelleri]